MTNQPMNLQETIEAVRQWGVAKGITGPTGKGTLLGQLTKTQEELTETRDAAMKWLLSTSLVRGHVGERYTEAMLDQVKDGIGDLTVTAILAAEMAGLRFEDCLAAAYDEIKGRTGRMEGGVFVKDKPC
jgi:NTP pyrophosphatase (non-canonical NTP hydrolase)